jgi:copper chaperone
MTCEGCSNAIKRVLGKLEGISAVETNVAEKLVVVRGSGACEPRVLEALKKWGTAANKSVEIL